MLQRPEGGTLLAIAVKLTKYYPLDRPPRFLFTLTVGNLTKVTTTISRAN